MGRIGLSWVVLGWALPPSLAALPLHSSQVCVPGGFSTSGAVLIHRFLAFGGLHFLPGPQSFIRSLRRSLFGFQDFFLRGVIFGYQEVTYGHLSAFRRGPVRVPRHCKGTPPICNPSYPIFHPILFAPSHPIPSHPIRSHL